MYKSEAVSQFAELTCADDFWLDYDRMKPTSRNSVVRLYKVHTLQRYRVLEARLARRYVSQCPISAEGGARAVEVAYAALQE